MAKKKSEGQQVREAFDGPKVEHDDLMSFLNERIAEQHARSADASESSSKTTKFVDETGLNSQAVSWAGSILKKLPKKDGQAKAMDVIRSMKLMLPMLENHVGGQGTQEMDLDGPEEEEGANEAEDGDPELAEDAAEFEETSNSTVTPISFGGASK